MNPQALLQENTQLQSQVHALETEKSTLQTEKESLATQLLQSNSQLEWLKRQIFGKRSEKIINKEDQEQLAFEGFEIEKPPKDKQTEVKGHTRKKKNKGKDTITLPADLPIEKETIDLLERREGMSNYQKTSRKNWRRDHK